MSDYRSDCVKEQYIQETLTQPGILGAEVRNRQLIPNLKAQRNELTNRIQKIDTLLQLLEKNPEFVKMLDLTRELI